MQIQSNMHVCPICNGKGQHQLVSSYIKQNSSFSEGESTTSGGGDAWRGNTRIGVTSFGSTTYSSSRSATPLANEIMPPTAPEEPSKPNAICLLISIVCFLLAAYGLIQGIRFDQFLQGIVWGTVMVLIGLLFRLFWQGSQKKHSEMVQKYNLRRDAYLDRLAIWGKLYVCLQDCVVYEPTTGRWTQSQHIDAMY